jgi:hypothetical protein
MDMQTHAAHGSAAQLSSTFEGHVLPGAMFLIWAVYWIAQSFRRGDGVGPDSPLESGLFLPVAKVVLPSIGVWVEIPGRGWYPMDVVMSWQHVTMYGAFALTGVIDLLARRGVVSPRATYLAFAAAQTNAGFLFAGHGSHAGVEGLVHAYLAWVFFAVAAVAVLESVRPSTHLKWMRIGSQIALGSWFIVAGWILYRSGWDLAAPFREGWSSMAFSWLVIGVAVLSVALRILADKARAPASVAEVG